MSGAILLLGPTGVYSAACSKTEGLALSTNRLNAARRMASANTVAADAAEIAKRSSMTQIKAEGPLSGSGAPSRSPLAERRVSSLIHIKTPNPIACN